MMAAPQTPNTFSDFISVLVLVGLPTGPANRALSRHAIDISPEGVMVNVFNDLGSLPVYRDAVEAKGKPEAVIDLCLAAAEADAVVLVTSYRGRIPSMAHNAIDWLTGQWRPGALHAKPLAVVGQTAGCYSGIWSRRVEDERGNFDRRVIEPLTVPTLADVVRQLADDVHGVSAPVV